MTDLEGAWERLGGSLVLTKSVILHNTSLTKTRFQFISFDNSHDFLPTQKSECLGCGLKLATNSDFALYILYKSSFQANALTEPFDAFWMHLKLYVRCPEAVLSHRAES